MSIGSIVAMTAKQSQSGTESNAFTVTEETAVNILNQDHEALLQQWERIKGEVSLFEQLLLNLKSGEKFVQQKPDSLTSPHSPPSPPDMTLTTPSGRRGILFLGTFHPTSSPTETYHTLIRLLLDCFPEKASNIANAMALRGTIRNYLSQQREKLFVGKSPEWINKHSKALINGWYIDTNLPSIRKKELAKIATNTTGLKWGKDIVVTWKPVR